MEWTVYDFECADADARRGLVEWFDAVQPLDVPDDAESVHGPLVDANGDEVPADVAWVAEYVYVMVNRRVEGLLANTAGRWQRAVVADFDGPTETCTEAVLYRSDDGTPVERARYDGIPELSGQDMVYRFAMAHQFRFRAYAQDPPAPMITPLFGAFEAVAGMGWGSELMEYFERETGVAPTAAGLTFLEDDPVLDEGEYYDVSENDASENDAGVNDASVTDAGEDDADENDADEHDAGAHDPAGEHDAGEYDDPAGAN